MERAQRSQELAAVSRAACRADCDELPRSDWRPQGHICTTDYSPLRGDNLGRPEGRYTWPRQPSVCEDDASKAQKGEEAANQTRRLGEVVNVPLAGG